MEKGIKETKELITLFAMLPKIGAQAMEDGKIGIGDIGLLFELLPILEPAIKNINQVPGELMNLNDEERAELGEHISKKIQIYEKEEIRKIVELATGAALKFAQIARIYKEMQVAA